MAAASTKTSGGRRLDLSAAKIASNGIARSINRDIVLETVRLKQPVARIELARLSGLQPSTVSEIVEQLIAEGWVREGASVRGLRGRPSTMLSINDALLTFALDIRPDRAILAVLDLSGRFLRRESVTTVSTPELSVARIAQRMQQLREEFPDSRFEGIGISVPGRVHPVTQELLMAPNLRWTGFDLKSYLQDRMGLQTEIENDANACLLSECWSSRLDGVSDAVLVAVSEGVGAGILSGGQLQTGHSGLAGEFGHIQVDPNGPECGCGQCGCWEMMASSRAALRSYRELAGSHDSIDIHTLLRLTEEGDPAAVEAVTRQARALGRGLRLISAALSPEVILITGEITSVWEGFGGIVQAELQRSPLAGFVPRIVPAGDGESARLRGATAVLLHAHSGYLRAGRHTA